MARADLRRALGVRAWVWEDARGEREKAGRTCVVASPANSGNRLFVICQDTDLLTHHPLLTAVGSSPLPINPTLEEQHWSALLNTSG